MRVAVVIATGMILFGVRAVAAQSPAPSGPGVVVSGGYALLHVPGETFNRGWYGDVAVPIGSGWAIVGEVGAAHLLEVTPAAPLLREYAQSPDMTIRYRESALDVLGGVRVGRTSRAPVEVFGQMMAGLVRHSFSSRAEGLSAAGDTIVGHGLDESSSDRSIALQPGAGISVRLTEHLGARVQADYRRVLGTNGENQVRFAAGLAWHTRR